MFFIFPVVSHSIQTFSSKFLYFKSKITKMDSLFEVHFTQLQETTGRLLTKCGKCTRFMKYIPLKPSRLHCPVTTCFTCKKSFNIFTYETLCLLMYVQNCDETYNLPQDG